MKKTLLLTICLFALSMISVAQDFSVSAEVESRYVWRGQPLGGTVPSFHPSMSFEYKGLEVGAWGAYSFSQNPSQELDLYISYTFWKDMFTVIVTDYCFPGETYDTRYFNYHNATTPHVFEAGVSFNGTEKVPVGASVYTNFFGADAKKQNGKNLFSSYVEVFYNPTIEKLGIDLSLFCGAALNGQQYFVGDDEYLGFYGNKGFAVVNVGVSATKTFNIKDKVEIPLCTKLVFNPNTNKAYLSVGAGIKL